MGAEIGDFVKVVYMEKRKNEGTGEIEEYEKVLRGTKTAEDSDSVTIQRPGGDEVRFFKSSIRRIEKIKRKEEPHFNGEAYK